MFSGPDNPQPSLISSMRTDCLETSRSNEKWKQVPVPAIWNFSLSTDPEVHHCKHNSCQFGPEMWTPDSFLYLSLFSVSIIVITIVITVTQKDRKDMPRKEASLSWCKRQLYSAYVTCEGHILIIPTQKEPNYMTFSGDDVDLILQTCNLGIHLHPKN